MGERPVECSHCKKPIKVIYKEITEDSTIVTEMCEDCPVLQRKLHGEPSVPTTAPLGKETGLYCGKCDTNLEWVKTGNPLGCSDCYSVFSDILSQELLASHKIPTRLKKTIEMKRAQPIHIGAGPSKVISIALSDQLAPLHEALNEALKKENYEQAAWLRDQIKSITEKKDAK